MSSLSKLFKQPVIEPSDHVSSKNTYLCSKINEYWGKTVATVHGSTITSTMRRNGVPVNMSWDELKNNPAIIRVRQNGRGLVPVFWKQTGDKKKQTS